jgi:hypothetical protein
MYDKDYYKTLGLSPTASRRDIKTHFRKLMKRYHPDISKEIDAEKRYGEVIEAYKVLKDPSLRMMYDIASNFEGAPASERRQEPRWDKNDPVDKKAYYEKLLREKREAAQKKAKQEFVFHEYLSRPKLWVTVFVSSLLIVFLSTLARNLVEGRDGFASPGIYGTGLGIVGLAWIVYLGLRFLLPRDRPANEIVLVFFAVTAAFLYETTLVRLAYKEAPFGLRKGSLFGGLIFMTIFAYGVFSLESRKERRQEPQRTARQKGGRRL